MLKGQAPERVEAVVIDEEVGFALLALASLGYRASVLLVSWRGLSW